MSIQYIPFDFTLQIKKCEIYAFVHTDLCNNGTYKEAYSISTCIFILTFYLNQFFLKSKPFIIYLCHPGLQISMRK